ncbi:MAG: ribosome biogenesis factor YjgA [Burkholderiales bacterium]
MTDELPLSKTQRKKNDHALQELGEELVVLDNGKLVQLKLSERLYDAVLEAKTISKFGARSRQMQYIGRLMREDADGEAIRRQLAAWSGKSADDTMQMHLAERWRLRLLENDETLAEFLAAFPDADIPRLRTLIHDTRREHASGKAPKNFRELFRVLRETIQSPKTTFATEGTENTE